MTLTLIFICGFGINLVLSLTCKGPPGSYLCEKEPLCCNSGYFTTSDCGNCRACAKAEGEKCGNFWDKDGICAPGLHCKKHCPPIMVDGDKCKIGTWDMPGKCVKNATKEAVDDNGWRKAPKCSSCPDKNACRCALEASPERNENCLAAEWQHPDHKGYCFLENIQDPKNPTKHCFNDMKWSITHSRFYSYEACDTYVPYQNLDKYIGLQNI